MIVDAALVRRVEQAAARHTVLQADALTEVDPGRPAHWLAIDDGVASAMGAGRYVNRAVGVGLGGTPAAEVADSLTAFYGGLGLPASIELNPWVPDGVVDEFRGRGFTLERFRNVYAHDLRRIPRRAAMTVAEVDEGLEAAWTDILGSQTEEGSAARATSDEFCAAIRRVPGQFDFVAMHEGRPIASGSLTAIRTVAIFGGAATLPEARGRGAQSALLVDRLHRAARMGCNLVVVTAVPDSVSARNLLRAGFQLLYTQAVVTRPTAG